MNDNATATSYDEVPYESHPFPQSHPDRLAAMGKLFGMLPVPVTQARVLELGCAGGGNLIPMACHLPDSEFVGLDLSQRQVDMANETIAALELKNIRIEQGSIHDVDDSWGAFDYIVSHGVYSWVPDDVQDKILEICGSRLAPQGIGYVSYNTFPGWHMRGMLRHMMIYHARQFKEPQRQVQQARALVNFLAESVPAENNAYGMLLKRELELISKAKDYYLYHEHLEDMNEPVYFHQFMERAQGKGLQYLGEAEFGTMLTSGFSAKVAETLQRISKNIISTEQYMDFLRNRLFRQTLLCRRGVRLKRNLGPVDLDGMLVASAAAVKEGEADLKTNERQTFATPKGASAQTNRPITKAALLVLKKHWPRAIDLDELAAEAVALLQEVTGTAEGGPPQAKPVIAADLLRLYSGKLVELRTWQPAYTTAISDTPAVDALARHMAGKGRTVVNQRHELINLDDVSRRVVEVLDGSRDKQAVVAHLKELVAKEELSVRQKDQPITDENAQTNALTRALEIGLQKLAGNALLVG